MITFTNIPHCNEIGCLLASRVVSSHLNMTARRQRQSLHQVHVDFWVTSSHEGEANQRPKPQVLTNEAVNGFTILEAAKQRRKTVGLVVQGEHRLMHECKSGTACFS
jgi:hypothetical protein